MTDSPFPPQWQQLLAIDDVLFESAKQVLAGSDYVTQWGIRQPARATALLNSGDLQQAYDEHGFQQRLATMLLNVTDEASLQQQLRIFRQREMVRIIWRDLTGWADLAETVRELSAMADACVQQALIFLNDWQIQDLGQPCNAAGEQQHLLVIAMGKLGAGELNLSSDIDLIFAFAEQGETQGGRRSLSNEEFFARLGRKLILALDTVTADGFVFRVDMRLRPFGESGAIVASFDALENYYQTQGREWERYAMIKARVITGSEQEKQDLVAMLKPFVYRRYLDYGVFESLREMKAMIAGQLHQQGMEDNIKLGAGGIREIEFIGQVFQLIHGGRVTSLQQRPILTILDLLAQRQSLSACAVDELKEAYDFLRRTEHRIQAWQDKQTHLLPQDEEGRSRLAQLMGFTEWAVFSDALAQHRLQVQSHFERILIAPQADENTNDSVMLFAVLAENKTDYFEQLGYQQAKNVLAGLDKLLTSHSCKNLTQVSRSRLDRLLPLLVQAAANVNNADECLMRLLPFIEAIMRRSVYMALLVENPLALSQLVRLCAASPWISSQLARHPVLLDELLDPRDLYQVPDRQQQADLLTQFLISADAQDLEQQMNLLREFRQIANLHVAAADVTDVLPLMLVGDQLTVLAEVMLANVLEQAWLFLVAKHGRPPAIKTDHIEACGFTVLAYGKLGGLELGYGSDLDLVFIYSDDESNRGATDGARPLDVAVFYTRLAQRMIHLMSTTTPAGTLYEIDMRLRPSGASGLLVSAVSGFAEYQQEDAWTWEHQALVRARCVVGDQDLAQQVSETRQDVLAVERDQQQLAIEVRDMRTKMREQLDKSTAQLFDLKQGVGGIADIEFMVQYAVLAWSKTLPELLVYTDNIRILDALVETARLNEEDGKMLAGAYRFYRKLANHCVLQEIPACVSHSEVAVYQPRVAAIWQRWLGKDE